MTESKPAGRRRWLLFLPFMLLVALAIGWSGFWYFTARNVETLVANWIEQEAANGRLYRCASRTFGGFPFRIEMRCREPVMELASLNPARTVKANDLVDVAQVYEPNLVIAEVTGPVSITEAGSPGSWQADWRLAQASLRGVGRRPERLSLALDDLKLVQLTDNAAEPLGSAGHVEFHLRRAPAADAGKATFDFAIQIAAAVVPWGPLGGLPVDAETTGSLKGLPDLRPKPMASGLKEWQAAGGRLELTKITVRQSDAVAVVAGDIGLSPAGRLDGKFNITVAGFDHVIRDLVGGTQQGSMQLGVIVGLSFLGQPAEIDGKRAISVPLRFTDGAAYLGSLPVGKVGPFF